MRLVEMRSFLVILLSIFGCVGCSKFVPPQQSTLQAAVSTDPAEAKPPVNKGPLPVKIGGKLGYVDRSTAKIVATPQFDGASTFNEGLAAVCLGRGCGNNFGGWIFISSESRPDEQKFGYIDETGQYVVNPQYDNANDFSEGLAAVCVGDCGFSSVGARKWGFIDKQGHVVIPLQFARVYDFSQGLAAACVGKCSGNGDKWEGKWGFIEKTGKFVIAPQFDGVGNFDSGGVASAYLGTGKNEKQGWIDKTGKFIWNPTN
jgi:hypothetical protein